MLSFENDYRAAHPAVLEPWLKPTTICIRATGPTRLSDQAKAKIREACGQPDADVWFLVGGTQTNQVVIDTITPAYAGVVAVASGHPNVHEAGAIEFRRAQGAHAAAGERQDHRIPKSAHCLISTRTANRDHTVMPGMVYLSQPTEYGTLYSKGACGHQRALPRKAPAALRRRAPCLRARLS